MPSCLWQYAAQCGNARRVVVVLELYFLSQQSCDRRGQCEVGATNLGNSEKADVWWKDAPLLH